MDAPERSRKLLAAGLYALKRRDFIAADLYVCALEVEGESQHFREMILARFARPPDSEERPGPRWNAGGLEWPTATEPQLYAAIGSLA